MFLTETFFHRTRAHGSSGRQRDFCEEVWANATRYRFKVKERESPPTPSGTRNILIGIDLMIEIEWRTLFQSTSVI
jgi:hypothetical protein